LAQRYDELERLKLIYEKAAKEADSAKKKYDEALKKPKSGLQSLKTMMTGKDAATVVQQVRVSDEVENQIQETITCFE
jgi:hypothetical protein